MNIRDAILKAADHIERNPGEFQFFSFEVPGGPSCGTPGCALGWIGTFSSMRGLGDNVDVARRVFGFDEERPTAVFYARMTALDTSHMWQFNAPSCAAALRKYADLYHPSEKEKRTGIPKEIRQIFERTYSAEELA